MYASVAADTPRVVPAPPPADCGYAPLAFACELLTHSEREKLSLPEQLSALARAFSANMAGLVGVNSKGPVLQTAAAADGHDQDVLDWPSETWVQAAARLRETATLTFSSDPADPGYLVTGITMAEDVSWLLWIGCQPHRPWTAQEQQSLVLVHQVVTRLLASRSFTDQRWAGWFERMRRQQQLERAAGLVGQLVHDFNNTLTGVVGFAELCLGQLTGGSAPHQFLTEVLQAAQGGSRLLNQISLFSKRGPVRAPASPVAPLLSEFVDEVVQSGLGEDTIRFEVPDNLPLAAVDSQVLRSILRALVDNALEAEGNQISVVILARKLVLSGEDCLELLGNASPGTFVCITVADNGPGFTAEARQRVLFDPFFSTKPRHKGFGLPGVFGALCGHRGGLRIDHPASGGAAVHVYLPIGRRETSTLSIRRASLPLARGEKVLVVDDDPLTLQLISATLERAGYHVVRASDGVQALEKIDNTAEPFRLVVSDVVMPRMTGFELAQKLLEREPKSKVLFTSGYVPAGSMPEELAGRQFELLPKPFRPEGLLRAVRTILDGELVGAASRTPRLVPEKRL